MYERADWLDTKQFETKLRETLPKGACERANICKQATERCKHDILVLVHLEHLRAIPERRWMDCYAYKQDLGMIFDKELGVYILPEWKDELMRSFVGMKKQ